jgi:UDP-N-acetylmuramate dehydrogenase
VKVAESASLKALNTFGIEAKAALLLEIETEEDVLSLPSFRPGHDLVLGGGSNILLLSDVPGSVFLNRISGRQIIDEQDDHVLIEAGAGENWHQLVLWSLEQGLSGLENLSLIPGLAGAAPMQNIGAYGVEVSSVLESVTAWDWRNACWAVFGNDDCQFTYRDSRFRSVEPDRYLITSIQLRLRRHATPHDGYAGLREELTAMAIDQPTPKQLSEAVIRIRQRKLPDPALMGNAGSFFKNPVVSMDEAEWLHGRFPDLPTWPAGADRAKLSAAWMIERCGWKGRREGQAGVSDQHSLVLVNLGTATGNEIRQLADLIRQDVLNKFEISLETEPQLIEFQV